MPEAVDWTSIYFTGLDTNQGHRKVTINWLEPGKGDWQWPILGYEVQVTTTAAFDWDGADMTTTIGFEGLTACPTGEDGTSAIGQFASGSCNLLAVAQSASTTHTLPGLASNEMYYFRIRARNHDGYGAWSAASYGVLTHNVPNKPSAPEIRSTAVLSGEAPSMVIRFDTPGTTGSNDCLISELVNDLRPATGTHLINQKCTVALSNAADVDNVPVETSPRSGVQGDTTDDRDCSSAVGAKTCQTVGTGSAVTSYRILMCKDTECTNYVELKDPSTGLSLYPMSADHQAGDTGTLLTPGSPNADYGYEYKITDLDAASTYSFVVQATNAAGESAQSDAVEGTTLDVPLQPHAPTATKIEDEVTSSHSEAKITLTWDLTNGYCQGAADTEPQPTAAYSSLNNVDPNTAQRTQTCPYDNGVALTGFRLFASSYNVLGTTAGGAWEPARRGSLSSDSGGTSYFSSPLDTTLPSELTTGAEAGQWLEIDVSDYSGNANYVDGTYTVDKLSQDTYYRFRVLFTSAVGDSAVSGDSQYFLTLEAKVSDLKMHTTPPCIYESSTAASQVTRFVATSSGTNIFYKWQLPDGLQTNSHDTRSFGSVIAEAGANGADGRCKTTDCSIMEFVLPSVSTTTTPSACASVATVAAVAAVAATCTGTQTSDSADCAANTAWTTGDTSAGSCAVADGCTHTAAVAAVVGTTAADCATGFTPGDEESCTGHCSSFVDATGTAATCPTGCTFTAGAVSGGTCVNAVNQQTAAPASCVYSAGNQALFSIAVVGYNTRGQTVLETSFEVQYCGCTDPWDPGYWDQATYHLPAMCEHESWDGADLTAIDGEVQYYQTFYQEHTHSAQVIVRVDEGAVDLYLSTKSVPDAAMSSTYFREEKDIQSWALVEVGYTDLVGSTTLYAAIKGAAPFSRFAVIASSREFSRGRGERYVNNNGETETTAGSTGLRRTQLLNIEPQALEIKTPYYDFFEYYFTKAANDVDVEIKVNCQLGCVDVFTSKIERFPSSLRDTRQYGGYWTAHNGAVCAESAPTSGAATGVTYGTAQNARYATASFDGAGGVYGMVTFSQAVATCIGGGSPDTCASAFAAAADNSKASCPNVATGGCTYTNEITVSVSLKGLAGDYTWTVGSNAVGSTAAGGAATAATCVETAATSVVADAASCAAVTALTDTTACSAVKTAADNTIAACTYTAAGALPGTTGDASCASTGASFTDDLPSLISGSTHSTPGTIFTSSATIDTGAVGETLTLSGESISSAWDGDTTDAASILGRSVVITRTGGLKYCATIYPDSTVTSHVGELSLMHTIRPEETVETCVSATGAAGSCAEADRTQERLLFASVQGALPYAVGTEQVNNEYTIEAKIYRYRVESNLLEPTIHTTADGVTESQTGGTGYGAEDRRYSVVSIDNFNYYEVELSQAAYGIAVQITLAYGQIELYTSKHKLPTQDIAGHDNLFGDVHAEAGISGCPTTCGTDLESTTLHNQFAVGQTYTITIPYSEVNQQGQYIFLGVLGTAPDSSYEISVTEYLFNDHAANDAHDGGGHVHAAPLVDKESVTVDVAAGEYVFFQLYVGPADELMYVTERNMAGSRTSNLGTDPDTWGIDWSEQLTSTWVEQQRDEWDLDVDVNIDVTGGTFITYGSSREPFPSSERGSDTDSVVSSSTGNLIIPHFTFSDKMVYISVKNTGTATSAITITPNILEMHLDQLTTNSATAYPLCPGESGTRAAGNLVVCSGAGSCIGTSDDPTENTCYCDNGFLGDDCAIEAFSSAANQPKITINADDDTGVASSTNLVTTSALPGDAEVIVPFSLASIPTNSKVHVYIDGLPYPAKGANVLYYTGAGPQNTDGVIKVFGMQAGVLHTVELLLLSADNVPLGTDMIDFSVSFAGGCSNGCSNHGVCHHGYCVCFDGHVGVSCEIESEDAPADFTPGLGFVTYNTALMQQERDEDAYISELKLDANRNFLDISDANIATAHAAVVQKLNDFVIANEESMVQLASDQAAKADALHRKRDRITTTIQQMREESRRLKTANTEAYLETVRALHDNQRLMQNELDAKRLQHFRNMAVKHDEWVEIKEKNDFKLNQLRTANGPLVEIDDLQERVCTQDDMFHTACTEVDASANFMAAPGYTSHGTVGSVGICSAAEAANARNPLTSSEARGFRCVCPDDETADCVKVQVDGEMDATAYASIPR